MSLPLPRYLSVVEVALRRAAGADGADEIDRLLSGGPAGATDRWGTSAEAQAGADALASLIAGR